MRIELSGAVQFADKNFVHRTISNRYRKSSGATSAAGDQRRCAHHWTWPWVRTILASSRAKYNLRRESQVFFTRRRFLPDAFAASESRIVWVTTLRERFYAKKIFESRRKKVTRVNAALESHQLLPPMYKTHEDCPLAWQQTNAGEKNRRRIAYPSFGVCFRSYLEWTPILGWQHHFLGSFTFAFYLYLMMKKELLKRRRTRASGL